MFARRASEEDEEPLLSLPVPHSRTRHQKPPACGVCCNTKCGAYFITALQMAFGLAVMLSAMYSNAPKLSITQSEDEQEATYLTYVLRRETILLWGMLVVMISVMTFKGISTNQHKLLLPTICLQYFHLFMTILQTLCTIVYWSSIALNVRGYLQHMMAEVETELDADETVDQESRNQWSEVEGMVKDDESWASLSPNILYFVTMLHTGQIIMSAWMIWTLLYHRRWLQQRFQQNQAVIIKSSVPGVVIQK